MNDLYATVRSLVRQELRSHRSTELGTVQAVYPADPDNYDADVVLRDAQLVLKHVPVATPRKGFASLPEVGDLVLVQFVGGDLNRPVVIGTLYNDEDRPPESTEKQWVLQLPSGPDNKESGLRVEVTQDSPLTVKVTLADKFSLSIVDDDPVVSLKVADTTLTIDGSGVVKIEGAGDVSLKAGGDLKLEAGGKVEMKASGEMVLKGSLIKLN